MISFDRGDDPVVVSGHVREFVEEHGFPDSAETVEDHALGGPSALCTVHGNSERVDLVAASGECCWAQAGARRVRVRSGVHAANSIETLIGLSKL